MYDPARDHRCGRGNERHGVRAYDVGEPGSGSGAVAAPSAQPFSPGIVTVASAITVTVTVTVICADAYAQSHVDREW